MRGHRCPGSTSNASPHDDHQPIVPSYVGRHLGNHCEEWSDGISLRQQPRLQAQESFSPAMYQSWLRYYSQSYRICTLDSTVLPVALAHLAARSRQKCGHKSRTCATMSISAAGIASARTRMYSQAGPRSTAEQPVAASICLPYTCRRSDLAVTHARPLKSRGRAFRTRASLGYVHFMLKENAAALLTLPAGLRAQANSHLHRGEDQCPTEERCEQRCR